MKIRRYQPEDAAALAEIFTEAIRSTANRDYLPHQIDAWAFGPTDMSDWSKRLGSQIVFIAEEDTEVAGYITFDPNGHLDHLYVQSRFQRQGVASMLYSRVEQEARLLGLPRIFTEASITARPFFESRGFLLIAPQTVVHRGVSFVNYKMERFV
jgi:GNAT superfamily N-acetyltransferase